MRQDRHVVGAGIIAAMLVAALPLRAQTVEDHGHPFGASGTWTLLKDWTFGNARPDATIHNKSELDKEFYYRYIYDHGRLDGLPTYWSYHRDYPEGDPRSLHVFSARELTLKARVPPGGGARPRGIESGMLRAKYPVTPGMYIEMRARLPYGIGTWPAFWLGAGVQKADGTFSATPWPPEIDIFEFMNWQNRPRTMTMMGNVQTSGHPEKYGRPHDMFTLFKHSEYTPNIDFSKDFHVFALDWEDSKPIWLLDGRKIKQTYYEWNAPPAHILVTNQLGMTLPNADLHDMLTGAHDWDYAIDYIRVWRKSRTKEP
jgi:hypothetical protein